MKANLKVKILEHTKDPERVVAAAARLCYSAVGAEEIAESMSAEQVSKLIAKIVEMGHLSTLEHVSFTFAIEGISRVTTHQLVRHRIASYSQQSQRYVGEEHFEYVVPETIAKNSASAEAFQSAMSGLQSMYNELIEMGVPKEDARYLLPNAAETKIVVTMNARSLLHFFSLRCCVRAQWEVRAMADEMLRQVKVIAPQLFATAGASCVVLGFCPEGKFSCGRFPTR